MFSDIQLCLMDDLLIFQLLYDLWSLLSCIVTLSCFLQMQSLHWLLLRDIMMIYFGIIFLYDGKITRIYYPLQILSSLFWCHFYQIMRISLFATKFFIYLIVNTANNTRIAKWISQNGIMSVYLHYWIVER